MRRLLSAAFATALVAVSTAGSALAAEAEHPPAQSWPHTGIFGTFDRAALQRGLQVYSEVCAGCHGLRLVAYRNLVEIGWNEDEAKAFAAQFEVEDGPNDEGEMFIRPAILADRFVQPFPNENAARAANNGAMPPDLSLLVKARGGGEDYLYAVLIGYGEAPEGMELPDGMNYNPYFPGQQIAMPPPLTEDLVEYADGTKATVEQMARDVTHFLTWAAEPNLEERHNLGFKVILFLIVFTVLLYLVKRRVWSDVH
jgi:cytochrome c1